MTQQNERESNRAELESLITQRDSLRRARDHGGLGPFPTARAQVIDKIQSLDARIAVLQRELSETSS